MKSACGSVLPFVLCLLLVLSILVTSMLRLPGVLRRTVRLVANETQEMYLAESAVIAKLDGYPERFFVGLPTVEASVVGPWTEWRTDEFQFLLGNAYGRFATSEWAACASLLEHNLHERILQSDGLKSLSGNRRFFEMDSSAAVSPISLNIAAGDLTLDLGETAPKVKSFMAKVEGDVKIRGYTRLDTLRIYARGTVALQGHVEAGFAEVFGALGVSVAGDASLAGILLSKQNIEILDHAVVRFPSVAIAVGYRGNRLALQGKSAFDGLAIAPSGLVERDSSVALLDSSQALLPFCMDSRKVVFERRRL
jgi:hypothetical protein